MKHRVSPGAAPADTLSLFPFETAWARTRVLDAQIIETADLDLDAFARYRRIRILTCSASVQMLYTVLEPRWRPVPESIHPIEWSSCVRRGPLQ